MNTGIEFSRHPTNAKFSVSRCGKVRGIRGRVLIGGNNGKYKTVTEVVGGVQRNHYVHRLVAETFIPNPHMLSDVNHIDGDRYNNDVSNLEWLSHADNCRHAIRTGLATNYPRPGQRGFQPTAKVTP